MGGGSGRPSSSCRPATTRRRRRSTRTPASRARRPSLFLEKGNSLEAARLFGAAGDWGRAAELYAKSGYPLRAARGLREEGRLPEGGGGKRETLHGERLLQHHLFVDRRTPRTRRAPSLAGRLYEQAGELNKALQVYQRGSYFKEAAGVCMKLGEYHKAAELYMRAEQPTLAAQARRRRATRSRPRTCWARWRSRRSAWPRPPAYFQEGQDYLRAAELFESIGMLAEAAGAYEAGESWAAAGNVYARAGLKDKAATSYERAGDLETAAKLYEEAATAQGHRAVRARGPHVQERRGGGQSGDHDKAIALLQRVAP